MREGKVAKWMMLGLMILSLAIYGQVAIVTGNDFEDAYDIERTNDGGYVIVGGTASFGGLSRNVYIAKLDSNFNMQWSRVISSGYDEYGLSVIQTSDGGYAIAGQIRSLLINTSTMSWDVFVIKLDANGNIEWSQVVGGTNDDGTLFNGGIEIVQSDDGGFVVAANTTSFGVNPGFPDILVFKLNPNGDLVWARTFGRFDNDFATSLIKTNVGSYAVAGLTVQLVEGAYLIGFDDNGNPTWNYFFRKGNGNIVNHPVRIIQTVTGELIIGAPLNTVAGNTHFFIATVDTLLVKPGDTLWVHGIGFLRDDSNFMDITPAFFDIVPTADGGYAVTGRLDSLKAYSLFDAYVVKLDASGTIQWAKVVGNDSSSEGTRSIVTAPNNGYVIFGNTQLNWQTAYEDMFIAKLNSNGTLLPDTCLINSNNPKWIHDTTFWFILDTEVVVTTPPVQTIKNFFTTIDSANNVSLLCGYVSSTTNDTTTSVELINDYNGFDYLIVNNRTIYVYFPENKGVFEITLYDLSGKAIISTKSSGAGWKKIATVPNRGLYVLSIVADSKVLYSRLFVVP